MRLFRRRNVRMLKMSLGSTTTGAKSAPSELTQQSMYRYRYRAYSIVTSVADRDILTRIRIRTYA
jgi:hypothetical protein